MAAPTNPAGPTLSNVLGHTIASYAHDENDTRNAALYSYKQDGCDLEAIFTRHKMDPPQRVKVALTPLRGWEALLAGADDKKNKKVWHAESGAELGILLDAIESSGLFFLVWWEGAWEPQIRISFGRMYKKKGGSLEAKRDFPLFLRDTPVASTSYILEDEGQSSSWRKEVADKVWVMVGKGAIGK